MTDMLQQAGEDRHDLHRDHGSSRPLSDGYEQVGLAGEYAFARAFRLPLDLERRAGGDGGIDFTVPMLFTVDVKTARNPLHLAVEVGKVKADIYVLARYVTNSFDAKLLGWEWRGAVLAAEQRDLGMGVVSHCIKAGALRPISELEARVAMLRPFAMTT